MDPDGAVTLDTRTTADAARRVAPELLAPAGDWDAMRAAVANGADAVYFGLSNFNARHRATNFTLEELPEVMRYLHGHNVRGYVTFNTLIFSDELPEALAFVRGVAEAGADAVIVQDLGLALLIKRMCPGLAVHGSTQMTLTEPRGIEFVRKLGVSRVILARELSAGEIGTIARATDVPVEVFVHGALCVAYSGQCLTSEALGGRSANRGQCAQACRLPYELVVDGQKRDLGEKAYLLSPQDLAAYDLVGDLARLGVCSFKIEGRLKSAQYVAATTQTYRAAIDAVRESRPFRVSRQQELELAQSFSRGFTHGFLDGVNHQELVHARFPKSRGVKIGRVVGKTGRGVLVEIEQRPAKHRGAAGFASGGEVNIGDGLVFDEGHPEQDEQGGRVASVSGGTGIPACPDRTFLSGQKRQERRSKTDKNVCPTRPIEITFDRGSVNLSAVSVGATVWKTDDPAIRRRLESSFRRDRVARRVPLAAAVSARVGERLTITVRDDAGNTATVEWDRRLEAAQKFPLTEALFREQFGRMGDSPFELTAVEGLEAPSGAMVPKSVLNDLRRQAVQLLLEQRDQSERRQVAEPDALDRVRREIDARFPTTSDVASPRLHVLARTMEQVHAALAWRSPATGDPPATVYCDFEDIRRYKEAVAAARAAGVPVGLATVRIIKPAEEGLLRQVLACEPDLVLVRNLAGLSFFTAHAPHLPLVADYALNIANEVTASLVAAHGVQRMVPSYDLNWTQLTALLRRFPPAAFEAVVHQHMPMFHMEHCVFAHTLSAGTSHLDCGRPCDRHRVDLRDRAGASHPLVADVGCRNTVYNAAAQSAAEFLPRMRDLGLRHFRVELLRETPQQAKELLDRYARVIAGQEDGRATWKQLRVLNQLGVTRGTLEG
jgi:U32 family peptidase